MLAWLNLILPASADAGCPDLTKPAKVVELPAACLGPATKLYAVRVSGNKIEVKPIASSNRTSEAVDSQHPVLKVADLEPGAVYLTWDPPTPAGPAVKLQRTTKAWSEL